MRIVQEMVERETVCRFVTVWSECHKDVNFVYIVFVTFSPRECVANLSQFLRPFSSS